jgi:RES domain-containing protein
VPTAWRIVKKRFAERAFDGEGARLFGGRWNSPGVPVIYVSSTRALAVLEMAVHLDRAALLSSFVLVPCEFNERLMTQVTAPQLPRQWRRNPPLPDLARVGDGWVRSAASAVLAVPSAIIPEEVNLLLNPAHPDFATISLGPPHDFEFDRRLIR